MKTTTHYTGHRWTNEELKILMRLWADKTPLFEIAKSTGQKPTAVLKQVQRLRKNGIPLERRKNGHPSQTINRLWPQGEIEYLLRRRNERATAEDIAIELNRTPNAVQAMISKLRSEGLAVPMRGNGVRRLWDVESLKIIALQQ